MKDFSKINFFKKGTRGRITCVYGESGSGKSTYVKQNKKDGDVVFDGDGVRHFINEDLSYSLVDRETNNIRIAKMADYLAEQGFDIWISTVRADIAYHYLLQKERENIYAINMKQLF